MIFPFKKRKSPAVETFQEIVSSLTSLIGRLESLARRNEEKIDEHEQTVYVLEEQIRTEKDCSGPGWREHQGSHSPGQHPQAPRWRCALSRMRPVAFLIGMAYSLTRFLPETLKNKQPTLNPTGRLTPIRYRTGTKLHTHVCPEHSPRTAADYDALRLAQERRNRRAAAREENRVRSYAGVHGWFAAHAKFGTQAG